MSKYNYYQMLHNVKKNTSYVLPEDINKPVEDYLEKIGCSVGVEKLKKLRSCIGYDKISLSREDIPEAEIVINISCGMADGYTQHKTTVKNGWTCRETKTIRNYNLYRSKSKVVDNDG